MPAATEMQQMEMEMVEGMYDTYELVSEEPPTYSVLLAATADDPPELKVTVVYPSEDYPFADMCAIHIENISKKRRLQVGSINKEVLASCEENMGTHCVIMALQQIQSFLMHAVEEEEKAELVRRGEAMNAAADAKSTTKSDPSIVIGTAVTKELFEDWSRKHHGEKDRRRAEEAKRNSKVSVSKLTGRQLWDSTLRQADWELFGGDAEDGEDVDVDFAALHDLDEDEFDFGDEDFE